MLRDRENLRSKLDVMEEPPPLPEAKIEEVDKLGVIRISFNNKMTVIDELKKLSKAGEVKEDRRIEH